MAEVENLCQVPIFVDLVVDQNRTMHKLSDPRPFSDYCAHARKTSEQIHVVQQRNAVAGGRLGVFLGNVADDFGEIVQRPLRVEEAVIH